MSNNQPSPLILLLIPLFIIALLSAPLILDTYDITDVVGINLSEAEITADYPEGRVYNPGEVVGSVNSEVKIWFDGGAPLVIQQDEPLAVTITKPLSSFVVNPEKTERLERMEYRVNYDVDDFNVIEVTADFMALACPLSDYCDEQGSPNAVILCGDTHNPCEIGFNGASPFVVVDLEKFQKENPDSLFSGEEEIRFVFKAEYVSMKLQAKADGALYQGNNRNLLAVADLPTDVNFTPVETILIADDLEIKDFMTEDLFLNVGDVVELGNGVPGIVEEVELCTGITNPPQPGQCTAGMCRYSYHNDRSVTVRDCD
jgi:hypothetical protein